MTISRIGPEGGPAEQSSIIVSGLDRQLVSPIDSIVLSRQDPNQHPEVATRGVVVKQEGKLFVVTFAGEALLRARNYLMDEYVAFSMRNIGWGERFARKMATAGFEIHDELSNSVDFNSDLIPMFSRDPELKRRLPVARFLRGIDSQPGEYFAMFADRAIFPRFRFQGRVEEEQVCFQILRAIDENYRKQGYATDSVGAALEQHEGSRWFTHGTGYELSAYANTQIRHFDHSGSRPFASQGPKTEIELRPLTELPFLNSVAIEANRILHRTIDRMGVAKNVYDDPYMNANSRDWTHPGVEKVRQFMFDVLEMGPRHSIRPIYSVK